MRGVEPVPARAPCRDLDRPDVLADLSDGRARQEKLELVRDVVGGQPDQAQAILVQLEAEDRGAPAPVLVDLTRMRVRPHDVEHLIGDRPQSGRVGSHHAEGDRKGRIGPEHELGRADAGLGREPRLDLLPNPELQGVARRLARRQDDDLGEGGIGQFGVVGQEEPRRPLPHIGRHDLGLGLLPEPTLHLGGRGVRGLDAAALGQLDLDEEFRPVGLREELLLHRPHAEQRRREDDDDRTRDPVLAPDGPAMTLRSRSKPGVA